MTLANLKSNTWTSILLVIVNVILINLVFRGMSGVRLDVTEGGIYSLSDVTKRILANLDERVTIRVYMSRPEKMPENLRPFGPQIDNLLAEYAERADGMIEIIEVTPEEDTAAEEEAQSRYGVESHPFVYQTEREQGVGSYYMSIVVQYAASSHSTITPGDLISQNLFDPEGKLELKNVEFALTRAIKKSIAGFEGKRDLFERFPHTAKITTYVTAKEQLPELFKEMPERIDKVLTELAGDSGGKLVYEKRVVAADEYDAIFSQTGIPPIPFTRDSEFYLWADVRIDGEPYQPLPLVSLDGALGEFELKNIFVESFKRMTPGLLRTVGIAQHAPPPNPMVPPNQQQPAPFEYLAERLDREYEIKRLDLATLTRVPPEVDVLIVLEPREIADKAVFAIDQYVMRGGKTIFCVDRHDADLGGIGDLSYGAATTGLEDLLGSWGVEVSAEPVFDLLCERFPWTVGRASAMGLPSRQRPRIVDFLWPAIPLIGYDEGSVNRDVPFLASFEIATMWFASALTTKPVDGIASTWLMRTSPESWLQSESDGVVPNLADHEKHGYAIPDASRFARRDLAVMLEGRFKSWFADRPVPGDETSDEETDDGTDEATDDEEAANDGPTAPLDVSPQTRILVFGDADWVHNIQAQIPSPYGRATENTRVLKSAVAWLLEDDDLAGIRGRGRSHRPLRRLEDGDQAVFRTWNIVIPLLALTGFGIALFAIRRNRRPLVQEEKA